MMNALATSFISVAFLMAALAVMNFAIALFESKCNRLIVELVYGLIVFLIGAIPGCILLMVASTAFEYFLGLIALCSFTFSTMALWTWPTQMEKS